MGQVLRIWGGSFHDYWFAEDAILKVRLVPQSLTLAGIIVLVALTALLGITGVILGALIAVLIYLGSKRIAVGRRARTLDLSVQDVQRRGIVTLRIPYSVISDAEIRGTRLTLSIDGRKVRVSVPEENLQELESLLRTKLSSNFTVSTS